MPRVCESCRHPQVTEINRKIRAGATFEDVSRWLLTEHDTKLSAPSIGQHAKNHLGHVNPRGRRPVSGDFLESVRDRAHERLEAGELEVTLKEGIAAQKALDSRQAKNADRDLFLKIAIALTGGGSVPALPDPRVTVIEGEFRPLLGSGD